MRQQIIPLVIVAALSAGAVQGDDKQGCECEGADGNHPMMQQEDGWHKQHHKGHHRDPEKMFQQLDLSDEQRVQMRELRESMQDRAKDRRQRMRAIGEEMHQLDPEADDYWTQVDQLIARQEKLVGEAVGERMRMHARMRQLLTPEQREQAAQMKREHGPRMGGSR